MTIRRGRGAEAARGRARTAATTVRRVDVGRSRLHRPGRRPSSTREPERDSRFRAVDLYSGVGGWTLGLKMAGIDIVASYEWWPAAGSTASANFGTDFVPVDIRALPPVDLPRVELVVGSPPCTQFSFANRGGGGDIAEGLRDVAKFLEIVEHVGPAYWVMENVPRVAAILESELGSGGSLRRFAPLVSVVTVVDMADFGLPQARRRMLAGRFPLTLLESYKRVLPRRTIGQVIDKLARDPVTDPLYGIVLPRPTVNGLEVEPPLTEEEVRMNREAKAFHPVYNRMSFPDSFDRPSRTVTATCTRVSRESIVVGEGKLFRRLTLRERASLQGFPITFDFYGASYNDRLKMVGNAIPPLMTFYVAHAVKGTRADDLPALEAIEYRHPQPRIRPQAVNVAPSQSRYPARRRFRAAIPNLRFGSGVRFELVNETGGRDISWSVRFYYGSSKKILEVPLDGALHRRIRMHSRIGSSAREWSALWELAMGGLQDASAASLQRRWVRGGPGPHPHDLVDALGRAAAAVRQRLAESDDRHLEALVARILGPRVAHVKLLQNADWVTAGFIVATVFNTRAVAARQERRTAVS